MCSFFGKDARFTVWSVFYFKQIMLQGARHRGIFLGGGFHIKTQAGILGCLRRSGAERADGYFLLLEVGEVFHQRLNAGGTEENKHVVVEVLHLLFCEIIAYSTIHDALLVVQFLRIKYAGQTVVVDIAHRNEVLLRFMFNHRRNEIVNATRRSKEHFTLTIDRKST